MSQPSPEQAFLTCAGWETIAPGAPYPVRRNPFHSFDFDAGRVLPEFCLGWCVDGQGELETEAGRQELGSNEGFLYLPGEWHRHRPLRRTGWVLDWIHFNGPLPHRWAEHGSFRLKGNKLLIEDPELFGAQLWRLLVAARDLRSGNSNLLSMQILGLFSHLVSEERSEKIEAGCADTLVTKTLEFILNHPGDGIGAQDIAAHLGCSRRTLEIRFKKSKGHTILDEIQSCRTERARALLVETDLPVKQIIHRSGFQSREQMRLAFQKLLGRTPGEVRLRAREGGA